MGRADVFDIVFVEVRLHCDAVFQCVSVVLRAGQRRQTEEFEKVDRQLILYGSRYRADRLRRVRWKAQNIPRDRQDTLLLPGEQHLAIFGDLVLALLGAARLSGLMFSKPDETLVTPARFAFSMKLGILWQSASTWIKRPIGMPSFSRSSISRSKVDSHSRLRAKLASVMKNFECPAPSSAAPDARHRPPNDSARCGLAH